MSHKCPYRVILLPPSHVPISLQNKQSDPRSQEGEGLTKGRRKTGLDLLSGNDLSSSSGEFSGDCRVEFILLPVPQRSPHGGRRNEHGIREARWYRPQTQANQYLEEGLLGMFKSCGKKGSCLAYALNSFMQLYKREKSPR